MGRGMKAYKFETTVMEDGIIRIPEIANLADQQVEVFVVVNLTLPSEGKESQSIESFLSKWRGFLKDSAPSG